MVAYCSPDPSLYLSSPSLRRCSNDSATEVLGPTMSTVERTRRTVRVLPCARSFAGAEYLLIFPADWFTSSVENRPSMSDEPAISEPIPER